jgi:hypothetical protein
MLGAQHRRLHVPEIVGGVDDHAHLVSALDTPACLTGDQHGRLYRVLSSGRSCRD